MIDIQGRSGHGKVPFVLGIFFFLMVLCKMSELGRQKVDQRRVPLRGQNECTPSFDKREWKENIIFLQCVAVFSQDNVEFQRGWQISSNFH